MTAEHINLTIPTPQGRDFTEDESTAILGQWVTVLFGGQSYMAQVQEVTVLPWDPTRMELLAKIGEPVVVEPEDLTPVITKRAGVHLNCSHDTEAAHRIVRGIICDDGADPDEITQDLGHGQA